jgi:hypothetical protein
MGRITFGDVLNVFLGSDNGHFTNPFQKCVAGERCLSASEKVM